MNVETKTKEKISHKELLFLLLGFLLTSISLNIAYIQSNRDLEKDIASRDTLLHVNDSVFISLITELEKSDSTYRSHIQQGGVVYDGMTLNTDQLVKLLNEQFTQISELTLEKYACQDSLRTQLELLKILDRKYGKNFGIAKEGNKTVINKLFNKADSALLLYPLYKDNLKVDENGTINIYGPSVFKKGKIPTNTSDTIYSKTGRIERITNTTILTDTISGSKTTFHPKPK